MLNHFNPTFLRHALTVMGLFLVAALLSQLMKLFLPSLSVDYQESSTFISRQLYRLGDAFFAPQTPQEVELQAAQSSSSTQTIAQAGLDWKLKAVYKEGKEGFIVIQSKNNSHFIALFETFEEYKLILIEEQSATLEKAGKKYLLSMIEDPSKAPPPVVAPPVDNTELQSGIVKRTHVADYMSNPRLIWENIKIRPYKEGGAITGFHITFVKKDSVFDHLGLRSNDLLIEANGVTLNSIDNAKELYKHIDEIEHLTMKVKRNGTLQELYYEIR